MAGSSSVQDFSEKEIENQILSWLSFKGIFAWKVKSVGTFDPVKKVFRTPARNYLKGVADILGIYKGKPLAIEVKSKKGKLSEHQRLFLIRFHENGGIAIIAKSVEDVEQGLMMGKLLNPKFAG